jgi:hypothetical protein
MKCSSSSRVISESGRVIASVKAVTIFRRRSATSFEGRGIHPWADCQGPPEPILARLRSRADTLDVRKRKSVSCGHSVRRLAADVATATRKDNLKHGEWLPWIEKNLGFSKDTARSYMRVFENRVEIKNRTVRHLTDAYRLLSKLDAAKNKPRPVTLEETDRGPFGRVVLTILPCPTVERGNPPCERVPC